MKPAVEGCGGCAIEIGALLYAVRRAEERRARGLEPDLAAVERAKDRASRCGHAVPSPLPRTGRHDQTPPSPVADEPLLPLASWEVPALDGALCTQVDQGELFYPEKGGSTEQAKQVCRRCPVQEACLQYALEHDERFGVWGGLSERERRRLKRSAA